MPDARQQPVNTTASQRPVSIKDRQAPLIELYSTTPDAAWIIDSARTVSHTTHPRHPLHSEVEFGCEVPSEMTVGVHKAVGGESDYPCPGVIFSAAIAGCLDSAMRLIANRLGLPLDGLEVIVDAGVDVRGTLQMDRDVPVGFQKIDVKVRATGAEGVSEAQLDFLLKAAERSCVVLQTLMNPPEIRVTREPAPGC